MSRISIDVPSDLHQHIKAMAALQGMAIKDFVLERVLAEPRKIKKSATKKPIHTAASIADCPICQSHTKNGKRPYNARVRQELDAHFRDVKAGRKPKDLKNYASVEAMFKDLGIEYRA